MKKILCLGIESTAHTFGASVVEFDGKKFHVLSNVRDMLKTEKGGLIPVQISEHHLDVFDKVIAEALIKSNKSIKDIQLISFSQGPGIGHALRIGSAAARSLALQLKLPLIGVNHCVAHLEISTLYNSKDPVLLYASGANTQVIAYDGGKYRVFGETLDIGIGNFLDTFARDIGLGFPGGPIIDQMAQRSKKRNFTELPYNVKGMDVSFSGIHTSARKIINEKKLSKEELEDLCFSVQETVFAMLIEISERAMAHCEKKELVLGGGVACNTRLREMAEIMCKERNAKCIIPENQYLVDNAAMIALLGIKMHQAKNITKVESSKIQPYERTDDIKVSWK